MKFVSAIVLAVSFLLAASGAEEVAISGSVMTNGTPISGARVSLKNRPELSTMTNISGEFTLTNLSPVKYHQTQPIQASISIRSKAVDIYSPEKFSQLNLSLSDISGKKMFSRKVTNSSGSNSLSIPLNATAAKISLLQLTIDNKTVTTRYVGGSTSVFSTHTTSVGSNSSSLKKTGVSGAHIDTVIITARSMKNKLIGIASYTQTIEVQLTASNPWKPTGDLIFNKGMVKILAKGYDFEMGQAEVIHVDDSVYSEQPAHTVAFTYDFWMDTAEVTQKQFDDLILKYYPSYKVADRSSRYGVGENIPVYYVYWDDAVMYCNMKSKEDGLDTVYTYSSIDGTPGEGCILFDVKGDITRNGYRLPTEAEWEYACRGGTAADFYWGKNYNSYPANASDSVEISKYAVWEKNSEGLGEGFTGFGIHSVGTTSPNAYGLYDMAGNLSEHVHDAESMGYNYGTVTDPSGPQEGTIHMVRGGNWTNDAVYLRSASRNLNVASYSFFCVGFRAVKTVK